MILNSPIISGSLTVTGNIITSGSITISGSIASASYASNADLLDGLDSTVFTLTSSFAAQTASFTAFTASLNSFSASILAQTASLNSFSASVLTFTGSASTRLGALESYTSSLNAKTASFATTGSNIFIGSQTITGSVLQSGSFTSTGTLTAQTLVVQTITSSVVYSSGSNVFGNAIANTQTFTGSVLVTGSLTISTGGNVSAPTIFGSTISCSPIGCFATSCATVALFTGCVGIGTTSPSAQLQICSSDGQLKLSGDGRAQMILGTSVRSWQFETSCGVGNVPGCGIGLVEAGYGTRFQISPGGVACFQNTVCMPMLLASGCVNIGTTTAYTSRLNVQATAANRPAIKAGYGGVAGNGYWILGDNYTTDESLIAIGVDYSSGGLVLGSALAPSTTTQGAFISTQAQFGGYGSAIRLNTSGEIYFYNGTQNSVIIAGCAKTASIALTIAQTGAATFSSTITGTTIYGSTAVCSPVGLFSGCVGIGISTPGFNLAINSSADCKLQLLNNSYQIGKLTLENNDLNIHSTFSGNIVFKTANNTTSQGDGISRAIILSNGGFIFNCNPTYCNGYLYNFLGTCTSNGPMLTGPIDMGNNVGNLNYCATPLWCLNGGTGGSLRFGINWSTNGYIQLINHNNCTPFQMQWSADNYANKFCFDYNGNFCNKGTITTASIKQYNANFGIAQFSQTFTAGTPTCFGYGSYNQGVSDNVAGLLVIAINEASTNITYNNAVWTGVVTNPRGGNSYVAQIYSHYSSCASSNISYLNVLNGTGNYFAVIACSASGAITLRANVTFIGGGGIS